MQRGSTSATRDASYADQDYTDDALLSENSEALLEEGGVGGLSSETVVIAGLSSISGGVVGFLLAESVLGAAYILLAAVIGVFVGYFTRGLR